MPTGGVSPDVDNLKAWFDAGVSCVGMGSKLISKEIIEERNFDELTRAVQNTLKIIQQLR